MKSTSIMLVCMVLLSYMFISFGDGVAGEFRENSNQVRHSGQNAIVGPGKVPTIDGVLSNGEWTDSNFIGINANGTWITFYVKHSNSNLYIASQCNQTNMCELVFDMNHDGGSSPKTDDLLLHASAALYEKPGTGTGWGSNSGASGWSANTGFGNVREWNISFSKLGITPGTAKTIGAGFRVMMSGKVGFYPLSGSHMNPGTWADLYSSVDWKSEGPVNRKPELSGGFVTPGSGLTFENFTFNVTYLDLDEDAPSIGKVFIDGTGYNMETTDTVYHDGSNFKFSTVLSAGEHKFYFKFNDSKAEVRLPVIDEFNGPNVIKPNSAPELISGGIPNNTFTIAEDSVDGDNLIDLEFYFTDDRDDGNLGFEIVFEEDNLKLDAEVDGNYLDIVSIEKDWFGTREFQVKAIDRGYDGEFGGDVDLNSLSNRFTITVNPTQDPAILTSIGTVKVGEDKKIELIDGYAAIEDEWYNFTIMATDADLSMGDLDILQFGTDSSLFSITGDPENPLLAYASFYPINENVGFVHAQITVKDASGAEIDDYVDVTIEVKNSNDDPEFVYAKQGNAKLEFVDKSLRFSDMYSAVEEEWFNISLVAVDPDIEIGIKDKLKFESDNSLDNLNLDPKTGEITFLPGQADVGTHFIRVSVMDDFDHIRDDYIDLEIVVKNINDVPEKPQIISTDGIYSFKNGYYVNFTGSAEDPDIGYDDNEKLEYTWTSDIDGIISITETLSTNTLSPGLHNITLTVTDNYGQSSSDLIRITIVPSLVDIDDDETDNKNSIIKDDKKTKEPGTNPLWIILAITAVILTLFSYFIFVKKKRKISEPADPVQAPGQMTPPVQTHSHNFNVPQQLLPIPAANMQPAQPQPYYQPFPMNGFTHQPQNSQMTVNNFQGASANGITPSNPPQQMPEIRYTRPVQNQIDNNQRDYSDTNSMQLQNNGNQNNPFFPEDTTCNCPTCLQPAVYIEQGNYYYCLQCQRQV